MLRLRRVMAGVLLVCGLLALVVGIPASWVKESVFDTDRYTRAVGPLIDEPVVRDTVSDALVKAVNGQVTVPEVLQRPLRATVGHVVSSEGFASAWEVAVRASHEHTLAAIRDEGRGLAIDDGTLRIELAPLIGALVPRLEEAGIPGTAALSRINGSFELVTSPELARVAGAAGVVDRWGSTLFGAAVVALLASVLISPRRGRTLLVAGLGTLLVSGVHWRLWGSVVDGARAGGSQGRETARVVAVALGDGYGDLIGMVAVGGAVALALGILLVVFVRRPAT